VWKRSGSGKPQQPGAYKQKVACDGHQAGIATSGSKYGSPVVPALGGTHMSTNVAGNLRPITTFWWLFVLFGVVTLGVGVFFVVSPHETLSTFTVIAGIFLLVDGVLAIFASIFAGGDGRGLLALIGVLSALAGLVLIKKPFDTLVVFTLIVGAWFVVAGIVRFVTALASPEGRGGNIVTATLDVIAGIVILSWPDLGLSTLAVIIGIVLILRGVLFILSGWQLHKLDDEQPVSPTARAVT
jgi:uncharacterized membrane protein HdeD (DUF308 family)